MLFQEENTQEKRQANLPAFEVYFRPEESLLKTNLPLVGLFCADSTKTLVKAGDLTL